MATGAVVAAGSALALYYVSRRGGVCPDGEPTETHRGVHFAPTSFLDDLYFLAEGLRYTYGETLGRWRTADLLIGLAYLCRKDPDEHPVADIAQQGHPFGQGLTPEQWPAALAELRQLERFFRYCSGLRERRPLPQRHYFRRVLGVTDEDLLAQELRAGVLKPSYVLVRDRELRMVVLAIRGTHSFKDMFTSLTGASKPHHLADPNGVVLGYSHFGMLAAARWIKGQTRQLMEQALADNPGYRLKIIGHSLGGGTAALLTMMLREAGGPFAGVTCIAVACPSCMTLELAQSCADYVTTVVHNADVIPTICPGSADTLREEVMRSSWFQEFRADVRASGIVRAVEVGIRGVGSATMTATSWTTRKLAACYSRRPQRRPQHKRRNSDEQALKAAAAAAEEEDDATEAAAPAADRASSARLPLSSSAPAGSSLNLLTAAAEAEGRGGAPPDDGQQQQQQQQQQQWRLALGQRMSSGTSQVLQTTSGLLRRMWSGQLASVSGASLAGRSSSGMLDGSGGDGTTPAADPAAAAEAQAGPAAPPSPMSIDEDVGQQQLAGEAEPELELEPAAGRSRGGGYELLYERREELRTEVQLELQRSGSLEDEVSLRMREVQRAVQDAEAEEAAAGRDDSTVPAVIRPGSYGVPGQASSARLSPSKEDPRWRRQMYPAGRILHLVPARLVPGTPAYEQASAAATAAAQAQAGSAATDAGAGAQHSAAETAGAAAPRRGKHAAQLSVGDWMAGEGLLSRRVSNPAVAAEGDEGEGDGTAAPREQGEAQQAQHEEMLLLEGIPQEAYARIKLCRTVLSDHIIPNYLRALESALEGMHRQAGVPLPVAAAAAAAEPAQEEQPAGQQQPAGLQQPPGAAQEPGASAVVQRGAAAKALPAHGEKQA